MKRYLLLFAIMAAGVFAGNSQTVLNEIYTDPGNQAGRAEFFELYNSGVAAQSVDCYTILTYWESGANKGWYVLDLPALEIGPKGYFVGAASTPFNTQSSANTIADFSWNAPAFRSIGSTGSLTKWQLNSSTNNWDQVTIPASDSVMNVFAGGNGLDYIVLVYVNGGFSNGFIGGSGSSLLPASITSMPVLPIDMKGSCTDFSANFATIGAVENVNSQPGSDNGYARTSDGKCGAWTKTSASVNHTPGVANGGAAGIAGALVTFQGFELGCPSQPNVARILNFDITGVSGEASESADFPVEVQLWYDNTNAGTLGQLDGTDVFRSSKLVNSVAALADTFKVFPPNQPILLIYKTKRGCYDKIVALESNCVILPVKFQSFTATRNKNNVAIKWETATEINNRGFYIQRNINGSWENIAFVFSQADNGNSNSVLSYSYNDLNTTKGVTQYRIQQVDLDGKARYSEIRSVRGEANISKLLVYPNPTTSGNVNVVFEDQSPKNVTVLDMSGRMIKQYRNVINNVSVDNLENGIYSIQVTDVSTATISVEKVVVKKR